MRNRLERYHTDSNREATTTGSAGSLAVNFHPFSTSSMFVESSAKSENGDNRLVEDERTDPDMAIAMFL